MARYPGATWKPISCNFSQGGNRSDLVVFHTASDGPNTTSLHDWFNRPATKASAHFFVDGTGRVEQYIDTRDCSWSAFSANSHSVSIETHDGGHPDTPWNQQQLDALVALTDWLCTIHGIGRHICTSPDSGGLGWHEEFPAWNHNGHRCPGPVRESQVRGVILPRVAGTPVTPPPYIPPPSPTQPAPTILEEDEPMRIYALNFPNRVEYWLLSGSGKRRMIDPIVDVPDLGAIHPTTTVVGEVRCNKWKSQYDEAPFGTPWP